MGSSRSAQCCRSPHQALKGSLWARQIAREGEERCITLSTWAQAVNPFFEPGVRVQRERGQQVISKGPYATVRHPGYASALVIFAGLALSLASWWALIPAAWASLILIVRTWRNSFSASRPLRPAAFSCSS